MTKLTLLTILLIFIHNNLFAQRFNISPEDGKTGLLIGGVIFFIVMIVSIVLHLNQQEKDNNNRK